MPTLETTHTDVVADEFLIDVDPTVASENYFAILGVDSTTSANLTTGGSAASNVGTGPVYNADHIIVTPTNALRLPVALTAAGYTIMLAFKLISGGSGSAARIFWASSNSLLTLSLTPAGLLTFNAAGVTDGTDATLQIVGSIDRWIFLACIAGDDGDTKIYNLTDETESSDGGGGGSVTANGGIFLELAGGASPGSNTWQVGVAAAVKCHAALTKEGIDAYYTFIQGLLDADRDIAV